LELIGRRADLRGLAVRDGANCQVGTKEALTMQQLSRRVRRAAAQLTRRHVGTEGSYGETLQRDLELADHLAREFSGPVLGQDVGVRLAVQMLQAEGYAVRRQLVLMLAATPGKSASAALAQRAVFDLSADVRETAVKALQGRPRAEYASVLLEALRYPWSGAADHAAEALVALNDQEVVFDLVSLLDEPDPRAPTQDKNKKWVVPELVRVNHLGNCLLCHAPSSSRNDPVRGFIPMRGEPLPPTLYYDSQRGNFVRADVTYLKQDFSVTQPVPDPGKWPNPQRFDFLIHRRELNADEVARLEPAQGAAGVQATSYPQRDAVLWALRELTGLDAGAKSKAWNQLLLDWYLWQEL